MQSCNAEQGIPGGAQGVVDMIIHSKTIRSVLVSGGFVLEEVLQDAGYTLKVCCLQMLSLQQYARVQAYC
jgi:hypothetical protein